MEDAFKSRVQQELENWQEHRQYAIVYTDINDFSYINENFGHEAGNKILKDFAERIRSGTNKISSRLYSDLFVTMIWDDDREKILKYVKETSMGFSSQQREIYPSCNLRLSAGIYYLSDREENLEGAIENANIARKTMKGGAEYCRVYESRMRRQREK